MSEIKIGDIAKMADSNKVFVVEGITEGLPYIPDGFLIDKFGSMINPAHCRKYTGAISVLNLEQS
jgi:hypothetical protein